MVGGVGEFSEIRFPYPVGEIFEVRVVSAERGGGDDPFGVEDFEGGSLRFRIVEPNPSVIASEGDEFFPENRRFREYPASGRHGRNEGSVPVEMVELFIRTSNEKALTEGQRFGINVERGGEFPEGSAVLRVEAAKRAVETPEEDFRSVFRCGRSGFDGAAEFPFPYDFARFRIEAREFTAVRSAVGRTGNPAVRRGRVDEIRERVLPEDFAVGYPERRNRSRSRGGSAVFEPDERPVSRKVDFGSSADPFGKRGRQTLLSGGFVYEMHGAVVRAETDFVSGVRDVGKDVFPMGSFLHRVPPFDGLRAEGNLDDFAGFPGYVERVCVEEG